MIVQSVRGATVESAHRVHVAVVDHTGRLVASAGDPEFSTYMRSAAKPFQVLPLLEDGAAERYSATFKELALACASHNSEPYQVDLVRGFLDRIGGREADLACGPHPPLSATLAMPDTGGGRSGPIPAAPQTPLASNCSGKHTAMLALARHHGWPTAGYHTAPHPVQRRCKDAVAHWAGLSPDAVGEGVDGCGVVSFALPVKAQALAYARLVASGDPAPRAIVRAMTEHPDLIAGQGRPCTALMQAYPARLLAKIGAEGVYGAALLDRGIGIGLKIEDGHNWAAVVALLRVLEQLGLEPSPVSTLPRFAAIPMRNTRGEIVGELRASGEITFV